MGQPELVRSCLASLCSETVALSSAVLTGGEREEGRREGRRKGEGRERKRKGEGDMEGWRERGRGREGERKGVGERREREGKERERVNNILKCLLWSSATIHCPQYHANTAVTHTGDGEASNNVVLQLYGGVQGDIDFVIIPVAFFLVRPVLVALELCSRRGTKL